MHINLGDKVELVPLPKWSVVETSMAAWNRRIAYGVVMWLDYSHVMCRWYLHSGNVSKARWASWSYRIEWVRLSTTHSLVDANTKEHGA